MPIPGHSHQASGQTQMKINATAEVTLTLVIPTQNFWGADCTIEQVEKQARDAALHRLNSLLLASTSDIRIVGTPSVRQIFAEVER
jgi:hypothetical protein